MSDRTSVSGKTSVLGLTFGFWPELHLRPNLRVFLQPELRLRPESNFDLRLNTVLHRVPATQGRGFVFKLLHLSICCVVALHDAEDAET